MKTKMDLRPSPIAGQWYPGKAESLAASVNGYIEAATLPEISGEIIAVIAPHAGHRYSGPVAGHAFAAVRGFSPEMVAVISPMHQHYHQPLLTSAHAAYQTPLGSIPIDQDAVSILDEHLQKLAGVWIDRGPGGSGAFLGDRASLFTASPRRSVFSAARDGQGSKSKGSAIPGGGPCPDCGK